MAKSTSSRKAGSKLKGKVKESRQDSHDDSCNERRNERRKRPSSPDGVDQVIERKRQYLESYVAEPTPYPEQVPVTIKTEPDSHAQTGVGEHSSPQGTGPPFNDVAKDLVPANRHMAIPDIFNSETVHRRHFEGAMEHVNMSFDPRFPESNAMGQLAHWLSLNREQMEASHPGLVEGILRSSLEKRFDAMVGFFGRLREDVAHASPHDLVTLELPTLRMARIHMGVSPSGIPTASQQTLPTPAYSETSRIAPASPGLPSTADGQPNDGTNESAGQTHRSVEAATPERLPATTGNEADERTDSNTDSSDDDESESNSDDQTLARKSPAHVVTTSTMALPQSQANAFNRRLLNKPTDPIGKGKESSRAPHFETPADVYLHVAQLCMADDGSAMPTEVQSRGVFFDLTAQERKSWRQLWQNLRSGDAQVEDGREIVDAQGLVRRLRKSAATGITSSNEETRTAVAGSASKNSGEGPVGTFSSLQPHVVGPSAAAQPTIPLPAFPSFVSANLSTPAKQPCIVQFPPRPHGSTDDRFMAIVLNTPSTPIAMPSCDEMKRVCTNAFESGQLRTVTQHDDNSWIIALNTNAAVRRACLSRAQVTIDQRNVAVEFLGKWGARVLLADITGLRLRHNTIATDVARVFRDCRARDRPTLWVLEDFGRKQLMLRFETSEPPPVQRWYIPLRIFGEDGKKKRVRHAVFKPRGISDTCLLCGELHRSGPKDCGQQVQLLLEF